MKTYLSFFVPLTLMAATLAIAGLADDILSQLPECAHGCVKDAFEQNCPPEDQTLDCLCKSHDGGGLEFLLQCVDRMEDQTCRDAAELCGVYLDPDNPSITIVHNATDIPPVNTNNLTVVECGDEYGAPELHKVSQDVVLAISVSVIGFILIVAGCTVAIMIRRRRSLKVPGSTIEPDQAPPPPYAQKLPQQTPPQLGDPPAYEQPPSTAGPATA